MTTEQARLTEAVAKLAVAIESGDCTPEIEELEALLKICLHNRLPTEAARVRRWLGRAL
jgi:uncharacterized protein YifE (UPF0438 family)